MIVLQVSIASATQLRAPLNYRTGSGSDRVVHTYELLQVEPRSLPLPVL